MEAPVAVALGNMSQNDHFALVVDGNRIRMLTMTTDATSANASIVVTSGILVGQTTSGHADAVGASAKFSACEGIAIDPVGLFALVADTANHRIRKIVIATQTASTLAGGGTPFFFDQTGTSASFNSPRGIALSLDGVFALVADTSNHRIRHIVVKTGVVTTVCGSNTAGSTDAVGASATFNGPRGVVISADSSFALVADTDSHKIRRIDLVSKAVTTVAGSGMADFVDGVGASAAFDMPYKVALTSNDAIALVVDFNNHRVRLVVLATGQVTTLVGSIAGNIRIQVSQ